MLFSQISSRLMAFTGTTPNPAPSNEIALEPQEQGFNHTLAAKDRPIGYFGPIRGRQHQVRVNGYRNDKGGCSWPDGRANNYMGGIDIDLNGEKCSTFNFKHHDLTEMMSMNLPTKWLFPQVKHCEVAFYQQIDCHGFLMGFLTERDARATETNCFEMMGAQSARAVCGENWWDVWDQAGMPWMDPNSPWYIDNHDEWLLDASGAVFGRKKYFKGCHPGDVHCVLKAAQWNPDELEIHDRLGHRADKWFSDMASQGKKLDFSKDQYRECEWSGRCGMMCPKGDGNTVLCNDDLNKRPLGEEYPYDQAWEIASPNLPGNTVGNQMPFQAATPP